MISSSRSTYLPSNDGRAEWSGTRQRQKERKKIGGNLEDEATAVERMREEKEKQ